MRCESNIARLLLDMSYVSSLDVTYSTMTLTCVLTVLLVRLLLLIVYTGPLISVLYPRYVILKCTHIVRHHLLCVCYAAHMYTTLDTNGTHIYRALYTRAIPELYHDYTRFTHHEHDAPTTNTQKKTRTYTHTHAHTKPIQK